MGVLGLFGDPEDDGTFNEEEDDTGATDAAPVRSKRVTKNSWSTGPGQGEHVV